MYLNGTTWYIWYSCYIPGWLPKLAGLLAGLQIAWISHHFAPLLASMAGLLAHCHARHAHFLALLGILGPTITTWPATACNILQWLAVAQLACRLAGLPGWLPGWLACWLACLVCSQASLACLPGWLAGLLACLACWPSRWLAGWLACLLALLALLPCFPGTPVCGNLARKKIPGKKKIPRKNGVPLSGIWRYVEIILNHTSRNGHEWTKY